MKLAQRIYLYLGGIFILAMTIFGVISYQREVRELETSSIHDVVLLGRGFAAAVGIVWQRGGEAQALKTIAEANDDKSRIRVRWVWLDDTSIPCYCPAVSSRNLRGLRSRSFLIRRGRRVDGVDALFAYFPVHTNSFRRGALELSESLASLHRQSRVNAWRLSMAALLILIVVGILMRYVGLRMVGQRMQKLVNFARQIGRGDLQKRLLISGKDEIAELCAEMNQMAARLQEAEQRAAAENVARISALEQLRHTDRLATLGKLSSGMAHELGTPLNVVSGRARLMEDGGLEQAEIVENARIIQQQTTRMTKIMRQMLDYAHRTTPHRNRANIRQLLEQVVGMLHVGYSKGAEIEFTGLEKPPDIYVDYSQIQQVLMNLMMNGLQAMPHGGVLTISLAVGVNNPPDSDRYRPAAYLSVAVIDSGPGIDAELLPQIFEPFFTTKGVGKGTGLGLSIAREIVQEHRGWILARNVEGRGACFTIYLPVEDDDGQYDSDS
ncbi:MAG: HAMP domain-containing protein [Deltaproteobacteria bacterium]|nr:HAMP domain-containing protein [Deltaproteobacteria bacterium]